MRIIQHIGRVCEYQYTINDANGDSVTIGAGDTIRVKIGRAGEAPILDLDSRAPSANGSTISRANPANVYLAAADLSRDNFKPGVYDLEVSVVDDTDSDKIKFAGHHVFVITDTQLGETGL